MPPARQCPSAPPTEPPVAENDSDNAASAVGLRIESYRPRALSETQWAAAGPAVRSLVRAATPTGAAQATDLLAALTRFLTMPCGWDGASAPDWGRLLTDEVINLATNFDAPGAGRMRVVRKHLRRLGVAAGARAATRRLRGPSSTAAPDPALVAAAKTATPVACLPTIYRAARGKSMTVQVLHLVIAAITRDANAQPRRAGTVPEPAAIRALAEASDQPVRETVTSFRAAAGGQRERRLSRRAIARLAETQRRAQAALTGQARPAEAAPQLSADIAAVIDAYRPERRYRAVWDTNRAVAQRLVTGAAPKSPRGGQNIATYTARFLTWFASHDGRDPQTPIDLAELLTPQLADLFIAGCDGSDRTLASMRSTIRRALAALNPGAKPKALYHHRVSPPYTNLEADQLAHLAANQATDALTANASLIIGLGLGAGLAAADLRHLTRRSITDRRDLGVLTVTVTGGARPRTVPIRHQYATLVRHGLTKHAACEKSPGDLLLGTHAQRNNIITLALARARGFEANLAVSGPRLRNTWLVAVLSAPIPLAEVIRAAGLASARTITELIDYCPRLDPAQAAQLLATLKPGGVA